MNPLTKRTLMLAGLLLGFAVAPESGAIDFEWLQKRGTKEGWTFVVGETGLAEYATEELCGLVVPDDWRARAPFEAFRRKEALPASLDLRPFCAPVKAQNGCGSCWAFATVGALECAIQLKDGATVDLAEQWLVSCNEETEPPHLLKDGTWGCNGGWFAHDYHQWKTDPCGGFGAVSETSFPYQAEDAPCHCPYEHTYWIDFWAYVGGEEEIPPTESIKQAIMEYGPVTAAVRSDEAFRFYTGGVFNADNPGEVNHAVVLVGWDDSLGENGAWILRNSWGSDWGLDGYMFIEYGCSSVGFATCFIEYAGAGLGDGPAITRQPTSQFVEEGDSITLSVEAEGVGALHYGWQKDGRPVGDDNAVYIIPEVASYDAGAYRCRVSDLRGTTHSATAVLQVAAPEGLDTSGPKALPVLVFCLAGAGVVFAARRRKRL